MTRVAGLQADDVDHRRAFAFDEGTEHTNGLIFDKMLKPLLALPEIEIGYFLSDAVEKENPPHGDERPDKVLHDIEKRVGFLPFNKQRKKVKH